MQFNKLVSLLLFENDTQSYKLIVITESVDEQKIIANNLEEAVYDDLIVQAKQELRQDEVSYSDDNIDIYVRKKLPGVKYNQDNTAAITKYQPNEIRIIISSNHRAYKQLSANFSKELANCASINDIFNCL